MTDLQCLCRSKRRENMFPTAAKEDATRRIQRIQCIEDRKPGTCTSNDRLSFYYMIIIAMHLEE